MCEIGNEFLDDLQTNGIQKDVDVVTAVTDKVFVPPDFFDKCIKSCSMVYTHNNPPVPITEKSVKYHVDDGFPCTKATEILLMDILSKTEKMKEIKHVCWPYPNGGNVWTYGARVRQMLSGEKQKANMRAWLLEGNLLLTKNRMGELNQRLIGVGFITEGFALFERGLIFTGEVIIQCRKTRVRKT